MQLSSYRYVYIALFVFIAQFIVLDIYYLDDLFRAYSGPFGWRGDGRALGGFFYKILLNFQRPLADIYPLPLLVAGGFFGYVITRLLQSLRIIHPVAQIVVTLLCVASPFALGNWFFRYDSAFMLLSVAFAILPFCYLDASKIRWFLLSVGFLVCALMTYQVALNIFIGLTGLYLFKYALEKASLKSLVQFLGLSIAIVIVAYLVYSQVILRMMPTHGYAANFREAAGTESFLHVVMGNGTKVYEQMLLLFKSGFYLPWGLGIVLSLYAVISYSWKSRHLSLIVVYFVALLAVLFAIGGVMLVSPNAPIISRTLLGLMAALLFPVFILYWLRATRQFYFVACYLCLSLLVIDRAAINAAASEVRTQNQIATQIMTEVSLNHITDIEKLLVFGKPRISNVAKVNIQAYPVVQSVLPTSFVDGYDGGRYMMMFHSFPALEYANDAEKAAIEATLDTQTPIASNYLYQLYYVDKVLVIQFQP